MQCVCGAATVTRVAEGRQYNYCPACTRNDFMPKPEIEMDLDRARRNKAAAMARVQRGEGKEEWMKAAKWAVLEVAMQLPELTSDDVWESGLMECPGSNRALGPVMAAAARRGILIDTGKFQPTRKADSHAQPIRIWKSGIHER